MISEQVLLTIFFITLICAALSGVLFLIPLMPIKFIKTHLIIIFLPIIIALWAFLTEHQHMVVGPFKLDRLSWLLASFVMALGFIIQKFSMRYLLGDHHYRQYFPLFTLITTFASMAWLSQDLRLMTLFWGLTLLSLTLLINVNRHWKVPRESAKISAMTFIVGWLALVLAVIVIYSVTGQWTVPNQITNPTLDLVVDLLLVIAVIIPAAQFPFQKWLIESVVAPTPVSAIMHAGIVNAGGVILTRFSPIFDHAIALSLLLIIASISVLLGSGISLVQVDYKRQLVGSTMSQMGFMLVQCALGVYSAAIIHLILHGIFKATLFLQSGSIVKRFNIPSQKSAKDTYGWLMIGRALAIIVAVLFWLASEQHAYELISALILAWSLMVSWNQLVAFSKGKLGRSIGIVLIALIAMMYIITHHYFNSVLQTITVHRAHAPLIAVVISISILVCGSLLSIWVAHRRYSTAFAILYLWLVNLGEARPQAIESHPEYLKKYL
ncbi:NADH dehydrogenase subunit 5 [Staphylococcus simiae]|nr:NADH dehydrogenase subunit 5 [Staphylococcus simiae]PNZ10961.1 NADH-quinone oxidoreductase subunit L [Staphylococcus simiae]SNV60773.1 NADH dehydrogenase, subunit 5 [Staphylococcus simiae]